ncbi:Zinc finger, C2H2 type [Popillia japonica]|uniref:Zinc finger, C2H2 type n=1 Tax=Popillia japonica TaxID=7064 RepID=A0AAW1J127_POPJA
MPKQEVDTDNEQLEQEPERFSSPGPYHDESSIDSSKFSNEDLLGQRSPGVERPENMQDEPENLSQKGNPLTGPLNVITSQRLPANFPFGHTSSPPSSTSSGSLGPFPTTPLTDPAKDPAIYTSLLPRPGSNDNSWESLIEVTKTSETSKLQQLVDNIEHKLSDPNQCVICHRVLSCKSALQMHYRTHTGERPFKCKICGRAFTTKGNLKTHMGVHRAKPPMRQHIRLHTGEPTDLTPEQIQAAEVKDFPSPGAFPHLNSMNPFLSQSFQVPGLSPIGHGGFPLHMKLDMDRDVKSEQDYMDDDDDDDDDMSASDNQVSFATSSPPDHHLHSNTSAVANVSSGLSCSAEDLCHNSGRNLPPISPMQNGEKSPTQSGITSPGSVEIRSSPNQATVQVPRPPSSQRVGSPTPSESNSLGALDLTPKTSQPPISSPGPIPGPPSLFSSFGLLPPTQGSSPLMTSALSSLTSSVLTSTSFSPLRLAVGPAVRGNTTCTLCFKTFACNSALEIHYRSHTKERPFKCTVCDRGFSTKAGEDCVCGQRRIQDEGERKRKQPPRNKKIPSVFPLIPMSPGYATTASSQWSSSLAPGNMKQHMLTHKIRDMPQHMFDKPAIGDESPVQSGPPSQQQQQLPPQQQQLPSNQPSNQLSSQPHQQQQVRQSPPQQQPPPLLQPSLPPQPQQPAPPPKDIKSEPDLPPTHHPQSQLHSLQDNNSEPVKRAPTENELPLPKRPPSLQASKHLCHVCNKNFSSSSALQIHMRTHTGDKPFRCTVCQKAFTTKGNLKVHMGTHMWSNGASRRGRRMSLDLPPIPMTPKDSEFLQRRPDLFYPYLPAPFLNGMQQKLNEISVVQNPQNGLGTPGSKYNLLGFGYPPPDVMRSQASSPERPPTSPPPGREPDRLWDLHFDRKTNSEPPRDELLPPNREGLAA